MESNQKDYSEIGEQVFNLVDNNKDKVNAFYDALRTTPEDMKDWFDTNVDPVELEDLFKEGQNTADFHEWLGSDEGLNFFENGSAAIVTAANINNQSSERPIMTRAEMTDDFTQIHRDIEDEDDDIYSERELAIKKDMSDGEYQSDSIDDEDEIELAIAALEGDGSDDLEVVFDVVDGSEEDSSPEHLPTIDDSSDEEIVHKKRIHLDHHVNKVVESIDDEEEVDRFVHKKYYVMKKKELESTERLNELEDELDKQNISYYDFGKNETIAIKIYESNEVKVNRILKGLNFECRCVDIAHYTDNWYS